MNSSGAKVADQLKFNSSSSGSDDDDAEKISKDLFILIRLLNNIHDHSETLVAQVICGTEKLDTLFNDPDLRSLTQYLNQSFTIAPMNREQIQDFYAGLRNKMAITGNELNNAELTDIYMLSKGIPGKTLELLQDAMKPALDVADSADDLPSAASTTADITITDTPITDTTKPYKLPNLSVTSAIEKNQSVQDPAPFVAQQEGQEIPSSDEQEDLEQEVSEILSEGNERRDPVISKVFYFKAALSSIVVVVTIVLAVVLSVDDEQENDRLAEILDDDSPLFMDEVIGATESEGVIASEGANEAPVEISIPPETDSASTNDTLIATTASILTETAPTLVSVNTDSSTLVTSNNEETDVNSELDTITQPDTPDIALTVENPEENIEDVLEEAILEEAIVEVLEEPIDVPAEVVATVQESVTAVSNPTEESSPIEDIETALNTAINAWLNAWAAGNFTGYVSAYHENFVSSYNDSYDSWFNERQTRIQSVQGISTDYDRFELMDVSEGNATVRLWLAYSRNAYSDETWKELQFQNDNGTWLIVSERNLQLIRASN